MRRALSIGVVAVSTAIIAVLATGAGGGSSYQVRAIFDSAFSVIPGEDVKIAGVKVGTIQKLDITQCDRIPMPLECPAPNVQKAAIVLSITKPGFNDFRRDATCIIRPQSLIGEKFVECTPTQPHPSGTPSAPPLQRIPSGQPGAGEYLLPVTQTQHTVDLDLINNILRLPFRQRLSIVLNELGTGLAGRGQDLHDIVLRADPALQQTDRVLGILAQQNRVLTALARDSDTILAPLARDRGRVADFITQANTTAQATAQRGADLQRDIARLPELLRQLRPTMTRLGGLADQATPVVIDLRRQGPAISHFIRELGPFAAAGTPALKALGDAAAVGRPALVQAKPVITDVRTLAQNGQPLAAKLAALTTSLHDTGGIERALDYVFYQVAAINGFDSFGHYLRASLLVNLCATYTVRATDPNCSANFKKTTSSSSGSGGGGAARAARAGGPRSPYLRREDTILRRLLRPGPRERLRHPLRRSQRRRSPSGALSLPPALLPAPGPSPLTGSGPAPSAGSSSSGSPGQQGPSGPSGPGGEASGTTQPATGTGPAQSPSGPAAQTGAQGGPSPALLDYLLGSG